MLSIIVPVYNEEENIRELYSEIVSVLKSMGEPYEILFVNDGSSDRSEEVLASLSGVTIISFRKNFGQTAALAAGFDVAEGDVVATMDGDRQNDPADIPKMVKKLRDESFDAVCGWRTKRRDPLSKRFVSRAANFLRTILVKDHVHDSGCTLRVYTKEAAKTLTAISGEAHRFIAALLAIEGFRVGEMAVNHRPRTAGMTKYNWRRTIKGLIDMVGIWFWRSYSGRPLHLFGGAGFLTAGIGLALGIVLAILRLFYGYPLQDKIWPLVFVLLVISGIQLLVTGLLADILVKQYYQSSDRKQYAIKKITKT